MFSGRRKSTALIIAQGASLTVITVLLYVGWVILRWRTGILLALGVVLFSVIITGVVLNTIFLVRAIRRNEQHDAFINAVTHELKTPVASIRLYLETLQSRPVDEDKRKEFYRIMHEDSDRLLSTIEQVLQAGRIGVVAKHSARVRLDLNALVAECVQRTRGLHRLDGDSLRLLESAPVAVLGDPEEVRAAISNLIENAVKYSAGQVDVTVETYRVDEKFVQVRVRDQGPGIPKTELKQIFKRFYRVPGPLAARVKGTGLGLFIVRTVAKRHRGRAWAESEGPGHGSTFVLQLPVAA